MASDDLTQLNTLFDGLIESLSPAGRRQLARDIARQLRSSQAKRIQQNRTPQGSPYEPRKAKARQRTGAIRRKLMFQKLIRTQWLKATSSESAATVSFRGFANQVAREHHYGLRSRIGPDQSVQMPERQLLGLTELEMQNIEEAIIHHLAL
jgi:phage virion morphogenesis protein